MTSFAAKALKLAGIVAKPEWRLALAKHRVAAGVEHSRVLRQLGNCQTVVDVGANRGQFALVARQCFPGAEIISFEPLREPSATYRAVFQSDTHARLIEAAIGPEPGESVIHVSERDDSSSLLPITATQNRLFPGTAEASRASIRVARLADEIDTNTIAPPALLKLDVQGFELQALAGCEDVLHHFKWVYAECSFVELYAGQAFAHQVIAWLGERGLILRGTYNMTYDSDGRAVQADFLFEQ